MDYGGFSPKYSQKLCYNSFKRIALGIGIVSYISGVKALGSGFMASSSQRQYQYKLHDALEVTEDTQGWTVIVQLLLKYPTKSSLANPNLRYKKFLFTDMKGTLIPVITFSALDHFDGVFQPFKRYYITNAYVRAIDPRYKIGEYIYAWTLYPRTYVQLIDDPKPYVSPYSFDFIKLPEMFRWRIGMYQLVVVLYTWEDANFKKTQPSFKLIFDIAELVLQDSASPANEKERQMFGQDTIGVVDEITTKVGVDEETSLAIGSVKKGMALIEARVGVEGSMIVEKVPSLGHETGKTTFASESLVKKLKNVVSHN